MPPVDRQHEGLRFLRRREGAGNFGMTMGGDSFTCSQVVGVVIDARCEAARMRA